LNFQNARIELSFPFQPGDRDMNGTILEHINITVRDVDRSTRFLLAALPDWRVRGEGDVTDWRSHRLGPKHVGLVVPSVDAAVARLAAAGYPLDHWGGTSAGRRSVYVIDPDSVQFEFVEYLSDDIGVRNAYDAA